METMSSIALILVFAAASFLLFTRPVAKEEDVTIITEMTPDRLEEGMHIRLNQHTFAPIKNIDRTGMGGLWYRIDTVNGKRITVHPGQKVEVQTLAPIKAGKQ